MADRCVPRTICPAYWFGDVVYLRVDDEHTAGMVTQLRILPNDNYLYTVSWGDGQDTAHYEFELSDSPSFIGEPT